MYKIGIDLGGTNIAGGLLDGNLQIVDRETVKTNLPTTFDRVAGQIAAIAQTLLRRNGLVAADIESLGVGVPCTANTDTGWIEDADHLGFHGGPLTATLEARLGIPTAIGNDADAAAWGEYKMGHYDTDSFILVTLGTGIGGGIILGDRLWSGVNHAAGEIGHMVIHSGGAECTCGRRGCFEAYGSATALIHRTRERMADRKDSLLWRLCGGDMAKIEAKTVFDAAAQGDETAQTLLDEYTTDLAEGFSNLINIFAPGCLCIGGGVSKAGEALLNPVTEKTEARILVKHPGRSTKIILARLGNDAGIIGAALLQKRGETQ